MHSEKNSQGRHGKSAFRILRDTQLLDRSSICSIRSALVNRISSKITMTVGLLINPRNKEVMEPCHMTGTFQASLSSAVTTTRSQEKEL